MGIVCPIELEERVLDVNVLGEIVSGNCADVALLTLLVEAHLDVDVGGHVQQVAHALHSVVETVC